ncbi:unnamed protein product [Allacma fusca]|uniref:Uncharacterized protein n=1 Tax=Allacma fusca TaxID=39272 RepID=A0A8J2LL91_9HEXA|nr:unnamed protein product [Allacma fusca]
MGKIRVKSFSKVKSGLKKSTSIPMEITSKLETPSPIKSSVSSGRISKSQPKKSVSFRSNLTDVVSAESLQDNLQTLSKGRSYVTDTKKSTTSVESRRSGTGKVLKKDKRSRMKLKRKEFLKKIELLKLKNREDKEAAKRKVIPIVGDTKAMLEALMSVTAAAPEKPPKKVQPLPKKRFSSKKRQEEIAEGLEYFAVALQHK